MARSEAGADCRELPQPSREELIEQNLQLRRDMLRLRESMDGVLKQLIDTRVGNEFLRESRRAALNLIEDAVQARHAQLCENQVRRRAENELRFSEEKYHGLFESIDEGFFIIERQEMPADGLLDFRFLEANPAVAIQAGVCDLVGKTMRQAFPDEREDWYTTFNQVATTGQSIRFEHVLVSQNRTLELYAFRQQKDDPRRVAVIFKDVSERKAAQEALRLADRRKDEFLATLAHELRNPLAPICNSLQLLRLYGGNDPDAIEALDMVDRQVGTMVRLVDDLMDVARITRGVIELRKQAVDLATVICQAEELSRPVIESFEHELSISLPHEPISLHGDPIRLGQVFSNLLNNAAKYTDRRGQIWLNVRRQESEAVVSVRDTGIGIPPHMLSAVFEIFTQADRSTNRSQGGLGIGLTLAKRLIDLHGGTISAHSDGPGKGCEVIVRLPIAEGAVNLPDPKLIVPVEPGAAPRRILIVDDNRDSAHSLGLLLRSLGTQVQTAHGGETPLEILASYRPDIVILDLGMPGMDGIEVAQRIREQPAFNQTKLIALTGWGQHLDRERTRRAGFNHHLVKPADIKSLQSLLLTSPS